MSTPKNPSTITFDPQVGNLPTPINSSPLIQWYINNLPAYRSGLNPQRRGLEIGMAHGYLLFGPFALLGPLRSSDLPNLAGLFGAIGLIAILAACLFLYSSTNPGSPINTFTTPNSPSELKTSEGWGQFTSGFLLGGIGGALFAYGSITGLNLLGLF